MEQCTAELADSLSVTARIVLICQEMGNHPHSAVTEILQNVSQIIDEDRTMSVLEITGPVKPSERTVNRILHNRLNMRKVYELWISRLLAREPKQSMVNCCHQLAKTCQ